MNGKSTNKKSIRNLVQRPFPWSPLVIGTLLVVLFLSYETPDNNEPHKLSQPSELKIKTQLKELEHLPIKKDVATILIKDDNHKIFEVEDQKKTNKKKSLRITKNNKPLKTTTKTTSVINKQSNKPISPKEADKSTHKTADIKQAPEVISLAALNQSYRLQQNEQEEQSKTPTKHQIQKNNGKVSKTEKNDSHECLQNSYKQYRQQQINANKWLRDSIITDNSSLAKQAHYEYNNAKQKIDDEAQLIHVLFKLNPKLLNTKEVVFTNLCHFSKIY